MRRKDIVWFAINIITFSICFSCDQIEKLSGGYKYRVDGSMRYILSDHIFHEDIYPNVIAYAFDDDYILVLQKPSKKHINTFLASDILTRFLVLYHAGEIKDLKPEDKEILVKGYVQDSSFYSMLSDIFSPDNTAEDIQKSHEIANELLVRNPYYRSLLKNELNYWIIDLETNINLGPMTKEEFDDHSLMSKISESLKSEFKNNVNELPPR